MKKCAANGKVKVYTKDVVCLPSTPGDIFPIPRGGKRSQLAESGLIGKVSLKSTWNRAEVYSEISSVFKKAFKLQDGEDLPFEYLR